MFCDKFHTIPPFYRQFTRNAEGYERKKQILTSLRKNAIIILLHNCITDKGRRIIPNGTLHIRLLFGNCVATRWSGTFGVCSALQSALFLSEK